MSLLDHTIVPSQRASGIDVCTYPQIVYRSPTVTTAFAGWRMIADTCGGGLGAAGVELGGAVGRTTRGAATSLHARAGSSASESAIWVNRAMRTGA